MRILKFLSFGILFLFVSIQLNAQIIFSNPAPIDLPDGMPPIKASPYGSEIEVNGMSGLVSSLTITLNNVFHNLPSDIDILLVAPNGASTIILSDVGGAADLKGINIVLKDDATNFLPDTQIHSGTYKPTNHGAGADSWPAPAPATSGSSTLSALNGIGPNGIWKLYAINDVDGGSGTIQGGWSISMTTQNTGVLPIRLKDFSAVYSNSAHTSLLTWTTIDDTEQNYILVESSSDVNHWKTVGNVSLFTIAGSERTYHYEDKNFGAVKIYYRLRFNNKNGSFFYSKVIAVNVAANDPFFSVFPVPAKSSLHINSQIPINGKATIQVADMTGRIHISEKRIGNLPDQLDIHHLNAGQYIVKINLDGIESTRKIIVTN